MADEGAMAAIGGRTEGAMAMAEGCYKDWRCKRHPHPRSTGGPVLAWH